MVDEEGAGHVAGQDVDQGPRVRRPQQAFEQGQVGRLQQLGPGVEEQGRRQPPVEEGPGPQLVDHRQQPVAVERGGHPADGGPDLPHRHPEEVEVGLEVGLLARRPLGRARGPQLVLDGRRPPPLAASTMTD